MSALASDASCTAAPRLGCYPDTPVAAQLRRRIVQRKTDVRQIERERERKKDTYRSVFKYLHKSLSMRFSWTRTLNRIVNFDSTTRAFRACRNIIHSDTFLLTSYGKLRDTREREWSCHKINTNQLFLFYYCVQFPPSVLSLLRFWANSICTRWPEQCVSFIKYSYDCKHTIYKYLYLYIYINTQTYDSSLIHI